MPPQRKVGKPLVDVLFPPSAGSDSPWTIDLPWPPSNNVYYRHVGHRVLISSAGRKYRAATVVAVTRPPGFTCPVKITLTFHPPDNRRRDLDNLLKCLFDSLKFAGVYADDSQVKHIDACMGSPETGGRAVVTLSPLKE